MIKSQVWEEWTALAEQRAVKKTQHEERVAVLLRILQQTQASLPADLEQAIRSVDDIARLSTAIDSALSSASVEDFRSETGL